MPVLNSLVGIPSSCTYQKFIRIFVEYVPKEFGRVELVAGSYRNFFLNAKNKKAGEHASGQKLSITFMYVFYATVKTQKRLLELLLLLFNQNITYWLGKIGTDTVILSSDAKTFYASNSFFDIFSRRD